MTLFMALMFVLLGVGIGLVAPFRIQKWMDRRFEDGVDKWCRDLFLQREIAAWLTQKRT
jgi:hypothetical protein